MPLTDAQIRRIAIEDLTWLDKCHCWQVGTEAFFVPAGQSITLHALNVARSCPARREEVIFAYGRRIKAGYFGGLSAGQRASMTLEQALEYIAADPPRWDLENPEQAGETDPPATAA